MDSMCVLYTHENISLVSDILFTMIRLVFSDKHKQIYSNSLPAHSGHVGAAGMSIPGAVGISGQAALGTGLTVQLTLVQGQLGHTLPGAHKQPLLKEEEERGHER